MGLDVVLLRSSFDLVIERQPALTHRFYQLLFERYPATKALFGKNTIAKQEEMLGSALVAVLDHLEDAPWLTSTLTGLGSKHAEYGVTPVMFNWVGECLIAAMQEAAGADFTPAVANAWTAAYGAIVGLMLSGYPKAAPVQSVG